MRAMPETLAARLALWYGASFAVCFGAAFLALYLFIDHSLGEQVDEDLAEDIQEFRILLEREGLPRVELELQREAASNHPHELFLRLLDEDGRLLFGSDTAHWPGLDAASSRQGWIDREGAPVFATLFDGDDEDGTRVISAPIGPGLWMQIGESLEERAEFMRFVLRLFALTFALVAVLGALVGWGIARRALSGVEEVSRAAQRVAEGDLESRVSRGNRGAEIERLADTFNRMTKRIRSLISGMREMTDNIAHDLRSPLGRIRAHSELALVNAKTLDEYQASAADTLEECDRLLEMINTTLDVAEAEMGASRRVGDEVDLAAAVKDVCELFGPLAEDKQIRLSSSLAPGCRVRGDRKYLQRMLANLVHNALKYTPEQGDVAVELSADERRVSVAVRDNGIGIPSSDQGQIFERFFRCDQSRSQSGFGLGLSLARAVARTHGGDLVVESAPGTGSRFTVTLPKNAPPAETGR